MRQDDDRQPAHGSHAAISRSRDPRRRGGGRPVRARPPAPAAQRADDLPGPIRVAQSAHAGRRDRGRATARPSRHHLARRAPRAGEPSADVRRDDPGGRVPASVPVRALRRPAAAGGHRGGARAGAVAAHRRRAGEHARRQHPRRDSQPPLGAGARPGDRGRDDHPRPVDRRGLREPDRGHVSRADRRVRADARGARGASTPLRTGPPVGGAGARSVGASPPGHPEGRDAGSVSDPAGLPLPPALPARLRPMPDGGSAAVRRRTEPPGRVPPGGAATGRLHEHRDEDGRHDDPREDRRHRARESRSQATRAQPRRWRHPPSRPRRRQPRRTRGPASARRCRPDAHRPSRRRGSPRRARRRGRRRAWR